MSSVTQTALRKEISNYIRCHSQEVPETQKERLISDLEQKVKSTAKKYMDEAKASVNTSNTRTFKTNYRSMARS